MYKQVNVRVFVQARMASSRFPGKVLAPLRNRPLIEWVIEGLKAAVPQEKILVLTSDGCADDPLVAYLNTRGIASFRGSEENVFLRFREALMQYPCDWVLRISADSPFLSSKLVQHVISFAEENEADIITTIFPRTFPKGFNAELIRSSAILGIPFETLTPAEREHVTPYFYNNSNLFRILNIESQDPKWAELSFAVDALEDLKRLSGLDREDISNYYSRHLETSASRG